MTLCDIARKCVNAKDFTIENHDYQRDDLESMLESLPRNLRKLEMGQHVSVTDVMVDVIAANFPCLEAFIMKSAFPSNMSSAGLISIFTSCLRIREIELLGDFIYLCLNDDVLISISQHCPQLSILKL